MLPKLTAPPALRSGGTIGIVAPSAPHWNRSDIDRGISWWRQHGYQVKLAPHLYDRDGFFAGSVKERVADLHEMFADPEVDVIQCLHGGYGATHLIPHLDPDLIRANPKPFVGRSDISVLHTALRQQAGLITFYGPGLTQVNGRDTPRFNGDRLLEALTTPSPLGQIPVNPEDSHLAVIEPGTASGPIVGGALWVICKTIGTPWQIDLEGCVFLLEETDEELWRLDAILTHLTQAGVFEGLAGVVVAELVNCDWDGKRGDGPYPVSFEDILHERLTPLGVPVVYGYPLGHGKHMTTTPLGVKATIDTDGPTVTIDEPAVRTR